MDSPKRKAQKNKDYRRHRMMRLLNRRKATAQEAMSEIAERELMRRLRITPLKKFEGGKDAEYDAGVLDDVIITGNRRPANIMFDKHTGSYYRESTGDVVTPVNKLVEDDPSTWSFTDKNGTTFTPHGPVFNPNQGEIRLAEETPFLSNNYIKQAAHNYMSELAYDINNNRVVGGKYTMPAIAAVAASPLFGNVYGNAAVNSAFAAHGLNHAVNEGVDGFGDAVFTGLEMASLGPLAKPLYTGLVKPLYTGVVRPGMQFLNSPITGKWTRFGNKEYRFKPGYLGMNGSPIEIRKLLDAARNGDKNSIEIAEEYGFPIGEKGVYRFVSKEEVENLLNGHRYNGRFGDGRVDVTSKYSGSTGSSNDYRITFKDDFDLYTGDPRVRLKNADLGDGWIMDGYSLDDIVSIENLEDGTFVPLTRKAQLHVPIKQPRLSMAGDTVLSSDDYEFFEMDPAFFEKQNAIDRYLKEHNTTLKDVYQRKISGELLPDEYALFGTPNVTKGLRNPIKEEILGTTIARNLREAKLSGASPKFLDYYKEETQRLIDDVPVGRFTNKDYKLAEEDGYGFYQRPTLAGDNEFISLNAEHPLVNIAEGHEARHMLDDAFPLFPEQESILSKAYDSDFVDLPKNVPEGDTLHGYTLMNKERVTTNRDARAKLLLRFTFNDLSKQDDVILNATDEEIFNAIQNSNGYGKRYIEYLRDNNKLTHEKAMQFRNAMIKVGSVVPVAVGASKKRKKSTR